MVLEVLGLTSGYLGMDVFADWEVWVVFACHTSSFFGIVAVQTLSVFLRLIPLTLRGEGSRVDGDASFA